MCHWRRCIIISAIIDIYHCKPKELCVQIDFCSQHQDEKIKKSKMTVNDIELHLLTAAAAVAVVVVVAANVWIIIKSVKQLTYIFHNHIHYTVLCCCYRISRNAKREAWANSTDSSVWTKCLLRHAWFIVACWRCRYFCCFCCYYYFCCCCCSNSYWLIMFCEWCDTNRLLLISPMKTASPLLYAHPYS